MELQHSNLYDNDSDSNNYRILGDENQGVILAESSLFATDDRADETSIVGRTLNAFKSKTFWSRALHTCTRRIDLRNLHFPNLILLLSTLWVVAASAGLAITFIIYITRHTTQYNVSEIWKEGAFLLDEGTHVDGSIVASRLMVLTISSASSIAMGTVTPVLLSIYAYRSAHLWLKAGVTESLTPHEYGLMIESLGAAGIVSLSNTGSFLLRRLWRGRYAAYMLKEAFCVATLAYVLAHTVGAMDLWLHTTTVTSTKEIEVDSPEPIPIGITQTMCINNPYPPMVNDSNDIFTPCNLPNDISKFENQALDIIANLSSITVTIPANSSGIATLITRNTSIPIDAVFQIATFGARATCASFNQFCSPLEYSNSTGDFDQDCNGSPSGFPWPMFNDTVPRLFPIISFPSSQRHNNIIVNLTDLIGNTGTVTQSEPFTLWLQFQLSAEGSTFASNSPVILPFAGSLGVALTTCNLSYYNVTLEYRNGIYTKIDEVFTAHFLSDWFSGALRAGVYNNMLVDNLSPIFCSIDATDEERMTLLTQELSKMATASAGLIANVTTPPLKQFKSLTLGRYPIYPVISLITLLFVNSAFAIGICILTTTSRARKIKVPETMGNMSVLDLAQLRLTSPLALITDLCLALDRESGKNSVGTNDIATFDSKINMRQIRVGIQEDELGRAVFRMWVEDNRGEFTKD